MNIKGVIFDLDGTLIDSMNCWEQVDAQFLRENSVDPPPGVSDIVKTMSITMACRYFISEFGIKMTPQAIADRIEQMVYDKYANEIPLKPGVIQLLDHLDSRGIPYGIATATYNSLACAVTKRLAIYDRLKFLFTCLDAGTDKNDPEFFRIAAEKLGCLPGEALAVDDALHCIQAGVKAGVNTAVVYEKTADSDWNDACLCADINIRSLVELTDIIK
ncbi:MAG: HAD family phosphatase [Oscillospiraceae bacterium]|nr:HAD family phosphatase [Oscillospiraceae bacterium]